MTTPDATREPVPTPAGMLADAELINRLRAVGRSRIVVDAVESIIAERDALRARIAELEAGLKPLADSISTLGERDTVDGEPVTDETLLTEYLKVWCPYRSPTVGHGRHAAALLANPEAP